MIKAATVAFLFFVCLANAQTSGSEDVTAKPVMLIPQVSTPKPEEFWIAIVGDSSVTGAATHPTLAATMANLLGHMSSAMASTGLEGLPLNIKEYPYPHEFNITEPIARQTRITYSKREYEQADAENKLSQLNTQSKGSIRLDTPEYSFGYMIGRKMGVKSAHIVNVGQDGKSFNSMAIQFERIFEVSPKLPPLVLVSYVANDFCHLDNFSKPTSAFREAYAKSVRSEFKKIEQLTPAASGTRILVLAPFDVANVLTNVDLLKQEIPFEGHEAISCGQLRKGDVGKSWGSRKMYDALTGACRGVLAPNPTAERIARIHELQSIQVEVLDAAIRDFNKVARAGLRAELATSTRSIQFEEGDLANDCFHPGRYGHARIAKHLLANELKQIFSQ